MTEQFVVKAPDFNLKTTLESGQVFGFRSHPSGEFHGRVHGWDLKLSQTRQSLHIFAPRGFKKSVLIDYFDLKRDLSPIYRVMAEDPLLRPAAKKLKGLRLIRQDSWEALACFIISSNNNVKRIQGIWRNLSGLSHDKKSFPAAREIARRHERTLREAGLGYRAPFLLHTAQFISTNPQTLDAIRGAEYTDAFKRVIGFPGIGPKVADCVLLYGFQKYESFPVDVWILRVMRKLYFRNRSVSEGEVRRFGQKRWGNLAGYVQQYLFHSARSKIL